MKHKILTCITCKEPKDMNEFPTVKGGFYGKGTKCNCCSKLTKNKFNHWPTKAINI